MSTLNQFVLRVDLDNADFKDRGLDALNDVFGDVITQLAIRRPSAGKVRDRNGNTVGEYSWIGDF